MTPIRTNRSVRVKHCKALNQVYNKMVALFL